MFIATRAGVITASGEEAYKYWRMEITAGGYGADTRLCEAYFTETFGGASVSASSIVADIGSNANYIQDNDPYSYWVAYVAPSVPSPLIITFTHNTPKMFQGLMIDMGSPNNAYAPTGFIIKASSDNVNFVPIKTISGLYWGSPGIQQIDLR